MMWQTDQAELLARVAGRQFIRRGIVTELDFLGTADGNVHNIAPAARVAVLEGEVWETPHWIAIGSRKHDGGGSEYVPLDVGAHVLLLCPGGEPGQMVVIGTMAGTPEEAGATAAERSARRVVKWGGLLFVMDRTDGKEQVTILTPNGHQVVLRDEVNSQGIAIQTGDGHLLAMADLDPESRLTLHHKGGTEVVFDEDGDWTATVMRDQAEDIARDRACSVGRNNRDAIGGNDTREVEGKISYTANQVTIYGKLVARLKSDTQVLIETNAGTLSGIHTALTDPVCCFTGIPRGATVTTKASA